MAQTAQEVLVQCPYEKSHAVRRAILPMHLAKCARNHNYSLVKCSFNITHHVSEEALEEHEKHCPDRHPFEASLVNIREENYLAIPIEHIELPPSTEDWDDGVTNKFNPKEVTKSEDQENFIIRTRHCLAPAERKAFRRTQCTEAAIFEEKRNPLTIILPSKKMLPMDTPLRRPLSAPKAANSDQPSSSTWKSVSSAEPQIQQQSVLDAVKKFSQQKQPLSPDATASLDVVPHIPVPTKEVAKDLKPVSELPSAGWLSTGRGKAIVALRSSLDSHILPGGSLALPVGFGRGQNVHFM